MLNSLEPEIAASIGLASTAKEMWYANKEIFLMMVIILVYSLCFNLLIINKVRGPFQNFLLPIKGLSMNFASFYLFLQISRLRSVNGKTYLYVVF